MFEIPIYLTRFSDKLFVLHSKYEMLLCFGLRIYPKMYRWFYMAHEKQDERKTTSR